MGWQKKKKLKDPYLTEEDRLRIARAIKNPVLAARKFKGMITLKKDGLDQEICIYVYGESEEDLAAKMAKRGDEFRMSDSAWKTIATKNLTVKPFASADESDVDED